MSHRIDFRVYYEDTDAAGVVYHARYLGFAERARTEALQSVGGDVGLLYRQTGLVFVVRQVVADYLRPARLYDWVTVETRAVDVKAASCTLEQDILCGAQMCARLAVMLACVDTKAERPARIPPEWRDFLALLRSG